MCIGLPMQIIGFDGEYAVCACQGEQRLIDTILVGKPAIGEWVLVFLDTAREIISPERAGQINNALLALSLSLQGETNVDYLFADLIANEPQLPEFLRPQIH